MPRTPANPDPTPEHEPVAASGSAEAPATDPTVVYVPAPSYLDRVRTNRMGPLAAALIIGGLSGLLLSMLVPNPANVWALILLGAFVAAAVGFGVRTPEQAAAFAQVADGVVVGSALVDLVGEHGAAAAGPVQELTSALAAAVHSARTAA